MQSSLWRSIALLVSALALHGCGANDTFNPTHTGGGSAGFRLDAAPPSRTVAQGQSTTYTVTLTATGGFASPVTLSYNDLQGGTTGTFESATVTPTASGATTTLTVATTGAGNGNLAGTIRSRAATATGTHTLRITASSNGTTQQKDVALVVEAPSTALFTIAATPNERTVTAGQSTTYEVTLTAVNGFSSAVSLSVTGQPSVATPTFQPATLTPTAAGAKSVLTVTTPSTASTSTSTLTITGAGGGKTNQATVKLNVNAVAVNPLTAPVEIAIHPNGQYAYVANNLGLGFNSEGTVAQFRVNANGTLTPLSPATVPSGGSVSDVAVDPSGKYVYATSARDGRVFQYAVGTDGRLSPLNPASVVSDAGANPAPNGLAIHPNGQYVYVANGGTPSQATFRINSDGTLTKIQSVTQGGIPKRSWIDASGKYLYSSNQAGLSQYGINTDGTLTQNGPQLSLTVFGLVTDPTGKNLYASGYQGLTGDRTFQFAIQNDGKLTALNPATVPTGQQTWGITMDKTGSYVYVTDGVDFTGPGKVWQFKRNTDGTLTPLSPASVATDASPSGIEVSPNGSFLYVTNSRGGTVSVYRVNADGTLTRVA